MTTDVLGGHASSGAHAVAEARHVISRSADGAPEADDGGPLSTEAEDLMEEDVDTILYGVRNDDLESRIVLGEEEALESRRDEQGGLEPAHSIAVAAGSADSASSLLCHDSEVVRGTPTTAPAGWEYVPLPQDASARIAKLLASQRTFRAGRLSTRSTREAVRKIAREKGLLDVVADDLAYLERLWQPFEDNEDDGSFMLNHKPDQRPHFQRQWIAPECVETARVADGTIETVVEDRPILNLLQPIGYWARGLDPWFAHPIYLIPKGDGGQRVIDNLHDISEACYPPPPSFVMPSPFSLFGRGLYMTRIDLADAYYQVRVSPRMRNRLGVWLSGPRRARFRALPMGFSWSAAAFDAALRPVDMLFAALGVVTVRYADDFAVLATSPEELARSVELVIEILLSVGCGISPTKTYLVAATRMTFLGHTIDAARRTATWAPGRLAKVVAFTTKALRARTASLAEVRAFSGLVSFLTSMCPTLRSRRRPLDLFVARHPGDASAQLPLDDHALEACDWWGRNAACVAGRDWPMGLDGRRVWNVATDASDSAIGVVVTDPAGNTRPTFTVPLPPGDLRGSGPREYDGVAAALAIIGAELREGEALNIQLDATVAVWAATRGTARAPHMVDAANDVNALLLSLPPVAMSAFHVPREMNSVADAGSRGLGPSDAMLSEEAFELVQRACAGLGFFPQLDLFSFPNLSRCSHFVTPIPWAGADGVDGLVVGLSTPRPSYAFPPFSLARKVLSSLIPSYARRGVPLVCIVPAEDAPLAMAVPGANVTTRAIPPPELSLPPFTGRYSSSVKALIMVMVTPHRR